MNKKLKIAFLIFAVLFGVFIFIYGGYDDSPGAQGLGVLAVIGGLCQILRLATHK